MITYCHECNSENECHFPFRPTRSCEDKDKFWSRQMREQYDANLKEDRESEVRLELPHKAI